MMVTSGCLVFSSLLKTSLRRAYFFLNLEIGKLALCKMTLIAKSCGVPFVLSFAPLSFCSDAGTSDSDGFYLVVDE